MPEYELDGDEGESTSAPTPAAYSREQRLAALAALPHVREHTLPPPLTSVLPPALPPLPLPLKVLRQRMGATGAIAPSLPPPLPMGKQCSPDQHTTCGCAGGTCECDLYPDYSPRHAAPSSPRRLGPEVDEDDEERAVVPPLRRLQFFNSNFKSKRPHSTSSTHSTKRSRALKEKRTGPSLQVLCFCRCPSRDPLLG